ncbi:hypothetical protein C8J56DRAFT_960724 [Mycena floridula]|nr:hypothetical protein C8J56DRAFT_960724 [Mycena floridula]
MGAYDTSLGNGLRKNIVNTWLFGFVCYQFLLYWTTKFNDAWWLKLMVLTLFTIDLVHSSSLCYALYCITHYGNSAKLDGTYFPSDISQLTFTVIFTTLAAFMTHVFLSWRLYQLNKKKYLVIGLIFTATVSCGVGFTTGIKAMQIGVVSKLGVLLPLSEAWLSMQLSLDLLITGLLGYVLYQSRTGFRVTDTVLARLIRGAVQTGLFASAMSLADMLAFKLSGTTMQYMLFAMCIGRMYTNTLMDTLLCRTSLQEILQSNNIRDMESQGRRAGDSNTHGLQLESFAPVTRIHIQTQIDTSTDHDSELHLDDIKRSTTRSSSMVHKN